MYFDDDVLRFNDQTKPLKGFSYRTLLNHNKKPYGSELFNELDNEQKHELADYMVEQWVKYKESIS